MNDDDRFFEEACVSDPAMARSDGADRTSAIKPLRFPRGWWLPYSIVFGIAFWLFLLRSAINPVG